MSSTSGTTSYRIDPLKGIENYATWKIKVIDILDDMGLSEHIEGPLPVPQSASTSSGKTASQSKDADWDSKDRKALTAIRLRVADTMLVYVANVKTAGDAWRILRDLFESRGSMGLVLTRRKIYKAECAEGTPMEEHIRVMRGYQEELASSGDYLTDTDFSLTLLTSLPESWNTFISAVDTNLLKNSHLLIARILEEDRRIRAREGKDSTALAAKGKGGKPSWKGKPGSSITCYNCQKQGHYARDCRSKKKASGNQDSGSTNQANQAKEAFIFAALDDDDAAFAADNQNSWIADSGVASHVCRDRNLFTDYATTQGGTIRGTGIINVHG
jgi:gag-polypeptide of LTR copia-type/Zinc knuckle